MRVCHINEIDPYLALNMARLHWRWAASSRDDPERHQHELHALTWYGCARKMFSPNPHVEREIANFSLKQKGNTEEALAALDHAIVLGDLSPAVHLLRTETLLSAFMKQCGFSDNRGLYLSLRDKEMDAPCKDYLKLISGSLWKTIELEPKEIKSYLRLIDILVATNQPDEALGLLEKGLRVRPESEELLTRLRLISQLKHSHEVVVPLFRRILRGIPDEAEVRMALARYLSKAGNNEDAEIEIKKALTSASANHEIHYKAARLYTLLGLLPQALTTIQKAILLAPGSAENWKLAGEIHQGLGEYGFAATDLEWAAVLTRDGRRRARLYKELASVYAHLNKPDLATKSTQRAEVLDEIFSEGLADDSTLKPLHTDRDGMLIFQPPGPITQGSP